MAKEVITSTTTHLNLFQRINQVMKQVDTVNKGTTVSITQTNSYKAVSHDDVTALLHRPITDAGLVAIPNMESAEVETYQTEKTYNGNVTKSNGYLVKVWASVTFVNIDNPEEKVTTKCYGYALDSGDKATGKAYSMAVKYCYLKTFMLESADEEESRDNENNWQNNRQPTQRQEPPRDIMLGDKEAIRPPAGTSTNGASEAQKKALKNMGIKFEENVTKQQASDLIKNAQSAKRN